MAKKKNSEVASETGGKAQNGLADDQTPFAKQLSGELGKLAFSRKLRVFRKFTDPLEYLKSLCSVLPDGVVVTLIINNEGITSCDADKGPKACDSLEQFARYCADLCKDFVEA